MTGNRAEKLFINSFPNKEEVIIPTPDQDMFEHWDVMINGIKYDVKSRKKVHIWDKEFTEDIIVELINVRGETGWSRGKADFLAFEQENNFLIIPREPLYLLTVKNLKCVDGQDFYERYYRKSRKHEGLNDKGLVTLVPITDVLTIPHTYISKVIEHVSNKKEK